MLKLCIAIKKTVSLGYGKLATNNIYMSDYYSALLTIPLGALVTLKYTIVSVLLGTIMALFISAGEMSTFRPIRFVSMAYVSVIRGTPLLLQLSIVYFAFPVVIKTNISITTSGIMCFSLNSAAYVAEIIRGGVLSIEKGQFEAAASLNINGFNRYRYVIAPQAIKNITPAMMNEIITLVKDTSIISIIGDADIMRNANLISGQYYTFFGPLIVAGATYYLISTTLTILARHLERKLAVYG